MSRRLEQTRISRRLEQTQFIPDEPPNVTGFLNQLQGKKERLVKLKRTPKMLKSSIQPIAWLNRQCLLGQTRAFHFTRRNDVPPIIWVVVRPIANIIAILAGRGLRKWWQKLAPSQQQKFWQLLKSRWYLVGGGIALVPAGGVIYYISHLEESPITERKRFIAFTHEQFMSICEFEAKALQETYKEVTLLDETSQAVRQVMRVKDRLCHANKDLAQMVEHNWTVTVVKSPEQNAFVLPTGQIFVFTGLLDFVTNDDQLAVVLGHEMAHALLSHGAEKMSFSQLVDLFIIGAMAAIWLFIPFDGIALITQWFYKKVTKLLLHMPYDRNMEKEADKVGINLMAKACYDVREAVRFWTMMDIAQEKDGENVAEFLSTHPSSRNRAEYFDHIMPRLLDLREVCKCPKLPPLDPRMLAKSERITSDSVRTANIARQNLRQVVKVPDDYQPK
ncbi:hypothetical protein ScPMuIL_000089 [Solemya velum]